ncbi:MAG: hypothetical protein L0H93_15400 [Nocardioides sp.]|nr:hypothetical protein [Nocardioides sp.]
MDNVNCLAGIACPNCGHDEEFLITCTVQVRLTDYGVDDDYAFKHGDGFSWDDASPIECKECEHSGQVADFTVPQRVAS